MAKVKLISFGFKYGHPRSNYYFDVSFAKNPARQKQWGFFANADEEMEEFVLEQENVKEFLNKLVPLIITLSKVDQNQVFALGCNAGRHRSVILVNYIKKKLEEKGVEVYVEHRDLEL